MKPSPAGPAPIWPAWPTRWNCAVIFGVTLLTYFPALQADFIWDDQPGHVTMPELQPLGGLGRIWFEVGATQQYYPLLHTAFWLEHRLWGDAPFGYHLLNVLLHAASACLFGAILRRLAVPWPWFAALLFALHPVCVESVAWVSEQKNTLSTLLYLLAARGELEYFDSNRPRAYQLATLWFVLALLTKTTTATLPAALLVVRWWQHGRLEWRRDAVPLAPWFALALLAGVVTAWVEHAQIGARGSDFSLGPDDRLVLAARAAWFYLGKALWPANLAFIYPRWTIDAGEIWQWIFVAGAAALLTIAWRTRTRHRGPLAATLFFGGTLFPALGFINVFPFIYSYVADHFQYVAVLGVLALVAGTAARLAPLASRAGARLAVGAILAALGALSWQQTATYRDPFTLYAATLTRNPACWMAHNNLGIALVNAGKPAEALPHYEQALRFRPKYAEAENNLGYALNQLGRSAEALPHLQRALEFQPRYVEAQNNLGVALMGVGRTAEGRAAFAAAIALKPTYPVSYFNLGLALATAGDATGAIPHFTRALELNPAYAEAALNWGIALVVSGRTAESFPLFERALVLQPDTARYHSSYGRALATAGRFDAAVAHYRQALDLDPANAEAHYHLSLTLRQMGRLDEALAHAQQAQQLGWRN